MEAKLIQFRRAKRHVIEKHYILDVNAKNRKEALSFVGKEVEWKSTSGKIIKGKISSAHGNKGLVRSIFEKGLPGQAITNKINVK